MWRRIQRLTSEWLPRATVRFGFTLLLTAVTGVVLKVLAKAGTPLVVIACIGMFFVVLGLMMRSIAAARTEPVEQLEYADVKPRIERHIADGLRLADALTPETTGAQAAAIHKQVTAWESDTRRDLERFSARAAGEFGGDTPGELLPNDAWGLSGYLYAKLHRLAGLLGDDYDPAVAGAIPAARIQHKPDCAHPDLRQAVNTEEKLADGSRRLVWSCPYCKARWPPDF